MSSSQRYRLMQTVKETDGDRELPFGTVVTRVGDENGDHVLTTEDGQRVVVRGGMFVGGKDSLGRERLPHLKPNRGCLVTWVEKR